MSPHRWGGANLPAALPLSFRPEAGQRRAGVEKSACTWEALNVRGQMLRLRWRSAQHDESGQALRQSLSWAGSKNSAFAC